MHIKEYFKDKNNRLNITIICSLVISFAFALFNGILGLFKYSIWNGSICVYYILLFSIKAIIIIGEQKIKEKEESQKVKIKNKTFLYSSILLFIINLALVVPIILMVLHQKEINIGLIPAITIATYTTYKVTISIINYTKNRKNANLIYRQIRTINLIDAILSVLTLQNTLILVNGGGNNHSMLVLSAISSFIGLSIIIILSIILFVRYFKEKKMISGV